MKNKACHIIIFSIILVIGGLAFTYYKASLLKLQSQIKTLQEENATLKISAFCGERLSSEEAEKIIKDRAYQTILAIKDKDGNKLASLVHPEKGIRFSPYAYVQPGKDLVFTSAQIQNIFSDSTKYLWGAYDGSGFPIELTFSEYYDKLIYNKDFNSAPQVGYNHFIGGGNTINNILEIYPNSITVEYHFPGEDPQYGGMDWESLRLVFEPKCQEWYLVGIVHDQWTT